MAEAKITLVLNPREFDVIREVLVERRALCSERSKISSEFSQNNDVETRRANNQLGTELTGILERLK